MDNNAKEILTILKNKYEEVSGADKGFQNTNETREYYLENLEDNLYMPMSVGAEAFYKQGSGNELKTKMKALRSSSALTYNLFWDLIAEIKDNDLEFGKGVYQVELEKQFPTLKESVSNNPANLDAFLYCKHTKEAIACEMKLAEWLFNSPGKLKPAYLDKNNYRYEGEVFANVAQSLLSPDGRTDKKGNYYGFTNRYDVFQMFKHALACYNACRFVEKRDIKKLTLVNCVWTLDETDKLSKSALYNYKKKEKEEREEFDEFEGKIEPIKALFKKVGVDEFNVRFCEFSDFVRIFNKTDDELNYLKRY